MMSWGIGACQTTSVLNSASSACALENSRQPNPSAVFGKAFFFLATDGQALLSHPQWTLYSTSQVPLKMLLNSSNYKCTSGRGAGSGGSGVEWEGGIGIHAIGSLAALNSTDLSCRNNDSTRGSRYSNIVHVLQLQTKQLFCNGSEKHSVCTGYQNITLKNNIATSFQNQCPFYSVLTVIRALLLSALFTRRQ